MNWNKKNSYKKRLLYLALIRRKSHNTILGQNIMYIRILFKEIINEDSYTGSGKAKSNYYLYFIFKKTILFNLNDIQFSSTGTPLAERILFFFQKSIFTHDSWFEALTQILQTNSE